MATRVQLSDKELSRNYLCSSAGTIACSGFPVSMILIGVFKAFTESTLHSVIVVDNQDLRHAFYLLSFQPVLLGLLIACSSASPRTSRTLRVRLSRVKGF